MAFNEDDRRLGTLMLTKEQLAAIGSVVVESTFCEELVEDIIWSLAGLKAGQGKFLTTPLQMYSRLELLSSLGKPKLRSAKKKTQFTSLISRFKEAINERNVVVHGSWQPDGVSALKVIRHGADKYPPAIAVKRRLNSDPLTASAADIEKTAIKLAALAWELIGFVRQQAWRRKSEPTPAARSPRPARTPPKAPVSRRQPPASRK